MSRVEHRECMPWVAKPAGLITFRCGVCNLPRSTNGRRMLPVRGLRVYVCQACASERDKVARA